MPFHSMAMSRLPQKTRFSVDFGVLPYFFLGTVLSASILSIRLADGSVSNAEKNTDAHVVTTPCWHVEEFVVAEECAACIGFDAKARPECISTGYVEKVNCEKSRSVAYKSCRSAKMERDTFWKFVGGMMGVSVAFALVVMYRQRTLDGRALEKVRKQIESI